MTGTAAIRVSPPTPQDGDSTESLVEEGRVFAWSRTMQPMT